MGVKSKEFNFDSKKGRLTGRYSKDVEDLLKVIQGLRADQELVYKPTMRETIGFVQDLRSGDDFFTAFDRNVKNWYWDEDAQKVEEALFSTGRRRK